MMTAMAAAGGALFGLGIVVMAFQGFSAYENSRANLRHWSDDHD